MGPPNFSLRVFLLSIGVIAALLGMWSERAVRQKNMVTALKPLGVFVWYDQRPSSPDAVSNGFFPADLPIWYDHFHSVHTVFIRNDELEFILPRLGRLPRLKQVFLRWGSPESDFLEVEQALPGVEVDRFILPLPRCPAPRKLP